MNTSTQLKALIRNLSRDLDINPEILHVDKHSILE